MRTDTHTPRALRRTLRLILLTAVVLTMAVGCTIIRRPPPDDGDNNGGVTPVEPAGVDVVIMTQLDRSAGNLAPAYGEILGRLEAELAERNVVFEKVAIAPLHRRSGGVVPLIYGRDDAEAEFMSPVEAISFYAQDNGEQYLTETASAESENLAALGLELSERAIYHPTTADPTARAYFGEPADGLLVITFSASERLCGYDDPTCRLDGQSPGAYFTATDGDSSASWLWFNSRAGMFPSQVFHAAVVTAEGVSSAEFADECSSRPNFPASYLDFMTGSQERYYGPLTDALEANGSNAAMLDLCEALSSDGPAAIKGLASEIARVY